MRLGGEECRPKIAAPALSVSMRRSHESKNRRASFILLSEVPESRLRSEGTESTARSESTSDCIRAKSMTKPISIIGLTIVNTDCPVGTGHQF